MKKNWEKKAPYKQNVTFLLFSLLNLIPVLLFSLQEHQDFSPTAFVVSLFSKAAKISCLWITHGDTKFSLQLFFFHQERKHCPLNMPSNTYPC